MTEQNQVRTRFAPSPTGDLHIGGVRTALFNYLFAKKHNGKFLLRIEDTDQSRSTEQSNQVIFNGLRWMGLEWDDDVVYQSTRKDRHLEIASHLEKQGLAYRCQCSKERLQEIRQNAKERGEKPAYDGKCRDLNLKEGVLRLKMPTSGFIEIDDYVQGKEVSDFKNNKVFDSTFSQKEKSKVTVQYSDLDDMVLVRSDGSPVYMLSVVVDDYDMGITHIIRGNDHLTNAFKQKVIYDFMDWLCPYFAHIPLVHGMDGKKLSKRHGSDTVDKLSEQGYLPEALRNHILRLGWSYGDSEIISDEQAKNWFNLESVSRSPSKFDFDKLNSINAHYLRQYSDEDLISDDIFLKNLLEQDKKELNSTEKERIIKGMSSLKDRSSTLVDLAQRAQIYLERIPYFEEKARNLIDSKKELLKVLKEELDNIPEEKWTDHDTLKEQVELILANCNLKKGAVGQSLRASLIGKLSSPSIFEIMSIFGKKETLSRISQVLD